MKVDVFLRTLGLTKRSGRLCCGFDSVVGKKDTLKIVFYSYELSERTEKNLLYELSGTSAQVIKVKYDMNELGAALGTKPVGIAATEDSGFARLLFAKLNLEVME